MNQLQPARLFRILILSCLTLLAGCGGTGNTNASLHRISLADIQIMNMRTLETTFQAGLRILNPTDTPIVIQGMSCELTIDGHHFASGLTAEQYEIPAYETAIIPVPVYASTLDMVTLILRHDRDNPSPAEQASSLSYELTGSVRLLTGENKTSRTVPFAVKGEMAPGGLRNGKEKPAA